MTVDELIQALQELNQPDLEVYVPCPHCCGQPGWGRLRPAGRRPLPDNGAGGPDSGGAGRPTAPEPAGPPHDLKVLTRAKTDLPFNRTIFWRLVRADLLLEAREGEETHYVVVVSPHRASSEEIEELQQYDRLMAQLTGANTHRVVASVATDRRAREVLEDGGPTGTRSCRRRLTMRVSSGGSDAPSGTPAVARAEGAGGPAGPGLGPTGAASMSKLKTWRPAPPCRRSPSGG